MPPAEIASIFLSATATDCRDYRQALKSAVETNVAAAKIHLQENWASGTAFVVETCRAKVHEQDAYIGLFGHRYGWVPDGFTDSITKLEWRWAIERWPEREPPIFILLPRPGSTADAALKASAKVVLKLDFPNDAARRKRSMAAQAEFIDAVRQWAAGRIINFYETEQQLREKGLSCVQNWNLELYKSAALGRRRGAGEIPGDELGRIGREPHLKAIAQALAALRKRGDARAIAFAVHGPENHGQRQFADLLAVLDDEWEDIEPLAGQLDAPEDPRQLARWACGLLRQPHAGAAGEIDSLVKALAARLEREEVVFVLRSFGSAADRWQRFVAAFWQPLLDALAAKLSKAAKGRLVWFVVDHESCAAADASLFSTAAYDAPAPDARLVVALPAMAPIAAGDVEAWLRAKGLKREPRERIAAAATARDGLPGNVYDRLQRENFWPPQP